MSMSSAAEPIHRSPAATVAADASRGRIARVATFVTLTTGLAIVATVAGTPPAVLPFILAFAPLIVGSILAWHEGNGALGRLLRMAVRLPRSASWFAVLALPVGWALATVAIAVATGTPSAGLFDDIVPSVFIVPLVVLLPAFGEEIGWRGYATQRLLTSMSPLAVALILAIPWVVPHLLLQLPGQVNAGLAALPTAVMLFSYAIILTWVVVRSGGSILLCALVHALFNGIVPLMRGIDLNVAWDIRAVVIAVIAVAVVALGGLRRPAANGGDARS
jgi:membrane protease YdiL (CAAX protease family)